MRHTVRFRLRNAAQRLRNRMRILQKSLDSVVEFQYYLHHLRICISYFHHI